MSKTPVKIDDHRHTKMKELAKKNSRTIQDEYAAAIDAHIAGKYQEIILADSKLEELMTKRLAKMEDRLAGLSARTGMDVAIVLMALTHFISKETNLDRNEVYKAFRKEATNYFSRPINNNKS